MCKGYNFKHLLDFYRNLCMNFKSLMISWYIYHNRIPHCLAAVQFPRQKRPSALPGSRPLVCSSHLERRVLGPPFCTVAETYHTFIFLNLLQKVKKNSSIYMRNYTHKYIPVCRLCMSQSVSVFLCLHPLNARSGMKGKDTSVKNVLQKCYISYNFAVTTH